MQYAAFGLTGGAGRFYLRLGSQRPQGRLTRPQNQIKPRRIRAGAFSVPRTRCEPSCDIGLRHELYNAEKAIEPIKQVDQEFASPRATPFAPVLNLWPRSLINSPSRCECS